MWQAKGGTQILSTPLLRAMRTDKKGRLLRKPQKSATMTEKGHRSSVERHDVDLASRQGASNLTALTGLEIGLEPIWLSSARNVRFAYSVHGADCRYR